MWLPQTRFSSKPLGSRASVLKYYHDTIMLFILGPHLSGPALESPSVEQSLTEGQTESKHCRTISRRLAVYHLI